MKSNVPRVRVLLTAWALATVLIAQAQQPDPAAQPYVPPSQALYDTIVRLDSLLFSAYNHCELDKFAALVSEDLEFYHDQGGLSTSKAEIMEALKKNICGKVTRELLHGSIEVYPIPGYGAVEMGRHFFHNNQEPPPVAPKIGKFVHIWQQKDGHWLLTRVISIH